MSNKVVGLNNRAFEFTFRLFDEYRSRCENVCMNLCDFTVKLVSDKQPGCPRDKSVSQAWKAYPDDGPA